MTHSLFAGHQRVANGTLAQVAVSLAATQAAGEARLLVFEDGSGKQLDLDTHGHAEEIAARYAQAADEHTPGDDGATTTDAAPAPTPRGPGRPRLGVVPREITLLPHHWDWLAAQPGGASVTLRKLVEHARKAGAAEERARQPRESAYRFLHAIAGDLPDYEEVTRALFAGDLDRMRSLMGSWPGDVRDYAMALARG